MIEVRDENFEHLTERSRNFQHNCSIQGHIDGFECDSVRDRRIVVQNSDIHLENLINCEFESDSHFDFAEHRHCVPRIDSDRDDLRIVIRRRTNDYECLSSGFDDLSMMIRKKMRRL
jgi:hypothetical protein